MSKEQTYTQCEYSQAGTVDGRPIKRSDVSWIPSEFAKMGRKILIDGKDGVWTIESVGGTKSSTDAIADSRDYLNQRKVSDIKKAPKRKLRSHMDY